MKRRKRRKGGRSPQRRREHKVRAGWGGRASRVAAAGPLKGSCASHSHQRKLQEEEEEVEG